ncbi:hypothetical protein ABFA25_09290 [Mycobacterium lepromatosis]|nr:hypothetical protein [Mycobacterium lepromatosis]
MPKTARLWLTAPSVVMTLASRAGLQLGVAGYQPATTVPSCTLSAVVASALRVV